MSTKKATINTNKDSLSRRQVWKMFDRISARYDLLNRLLSGGQDTRWRARVAKHLPSGPDLRLLDLATGTADLLISMFKRRSLSSGVGIDMAEKMLEIGRKKLQDKDLSQQITLQTGDATQIPFEEASFDAVTISFGIRNVEDVDGCLREMHRVLQNGGRAIILEFSLPENRLIRSAYLFYFRNILPFLGGMISGDHHAYSYLNKTVETFPYGEQFCQLMQNAGFTAVQRHPLTFGIATIYQGDK